MIEALIGFVLGCIVTAGLFVWANRNVAEKLDAAEAKIRAYTKDKP